MAENNPFPGENNTGHIWDDNIRELNNPIPRWWMIGFYLSLAWIVGYMVIYPTIPTGNDHTKGVIGWTQISEYDKERAEVEAIRAPFEDKLATMSATDILADEEMSTYAVKSARVLFGDNCAACHGAGGQGNPSYPVLADDDWLYGGQVETIVQTITNGRRGMMPAMAMQMGLTDAEIDTLANAVADGSILDEPLYKTKACFACHGMDGKGIKAVGSANLVDAVWRFNEADKVASAKHTIKHGVNFLADPNTRDAQMPSFKSRLSETDIKKLAVYVHKLGGGQ